MAEPAFREAQFTSRYDAHAAPINRLVDSLRSSERGWLPYVAPMYGGVHARLLSLLRDPGPKTQADAGSGFLRWRMTTQRPKRFATSSALPGLGHTILSLGMFTRGCADE